MIVCHCHAVTDRVVRAAIEAGAHAEEQLAQRCRAGTACGACTPALRRLLAGLAARSTDRIRSPAKPSVAT